MNTTRKQRLLFITTLNLFNTKWNG